MNLLGILNIQLVFFVYTLGKILKFSKKCYFLQIACQVNKITWQIIYNLLENLLFYAYLTVE